MHGQQIVGTAAFASTLLCVWMSAEAASLLRHGPRRIVTALALFALSWAILLLFYLPGPPQDEMLSSLSGFVLTYVGILLIREGAGRSRPDPRGGAGWLNVLPVYLFRSTLGGYGLYLVLRQLYRVEYGYGTLALALWGTALTMLGYATVWLGVVYLYQHSPGLTRIAVGLGALLLVYAAAEIAYAAWYARDRWPVYHRYLVLSARPGAPSFEQPIPVDPLPDWPDAAAWQALTRRPDWPAARRAMQLQVQPRLPEMWAWLECAFSTLKVLFTAALIVLLWRAPKGQNGRPAPPLVRWLNARLRLDAS